MWLVDYFKSSLVDKYATFSGRARRKEYGSWIVMTFVIGIVLGILDAIIGKPVLGTVFGLATIVPQIALSVRRLHDLGYSGWYYVGIFAAGFAGALSLMAGAVIMAGSKGESGVAFIAIGALILLACAIAQIAMLFMKGEEGSNEFGEDPKLDGVP